MPSFDLSKQCVKNLLKCTYIRSYVYINKNTWGQVTNPIICTCENMFYVIQGVKSIFEVTSWPQLISKLSHLPVCIAVSD